VRRFVVRRCLLMIPSVLGVTFVSFLLLRAAGLDPVLSRVQDPMRAGQVSGAALAQLRKLYDLDKPWYEQYAKLLWRFATWNLGTTWQDGRAISEVIGEALPITLTLTCASIALAYMVGVPLGVYAAVRRNSWRERALTVLLFMLYSLPTFWLGTLSLVFLASGRFVSCHWLEHAACFPLQGFHSSSGWERMSAWQKARDLAWHACLPVLTLSYPAFAVISRYARASMLHTLQQDFVRTARAKGLPERAVVFGHAMRNSLLPIVTLLGLELPQLIGGSVIVEAVFGVRGMGLVALEAIRMPDYPLVITIVTLVALLTMLGSLLADMVYAWLDPRIADDMVFERDEVGR
jgi:peptide/nickel transport system permease protein